MARGLSGVVSGGVRGGLGRLAAGFCCSSALTESKPARLEIVARMPVGGSPSRCTQPEAVSSSMTGVRNDLVVLDPQGGPTTETGQSV